MSRCALIWKVETVMTEKLQETMNAFEKAGYEVDHYEKIAEQFDGLMWIVVGWKPSDGW